MAFAIADYDYLEDRTDLNFGGETDVCKHNCHIVSVTNNISTLNTLLNLISIRRSAVTFR